jgi:hypothetical protein
MDTNNKIEKTLNINANVNAQTLGDIINAFHHKNILSSFEANTMKSYSYCEYFIHYSDIKQFINDVILYYKQIYPSKKIDHYTFFYKHDNTIYLCLVVKDTLTFLISTEIETSPSIIELDVSMWIEHIEETEKYSLEFEDFIKKYERIDKLIDINYYNISASRDTVCHFRDIIEETIYPEAYPYIDNIDKYIDTYLHSEEPILFLYGPVGTGKSKLIRYIMQNMSKKYNKQVINVLYASDEDVLVRTDIFLDYMANPDNDLLVLEDMDSTFMSRTKDNSLMNKYLVASDGIVKTRNKKMIFASNLGKFSDIDEALIRSGRCFDSIEFRKLHFEEANDLYNKLITGKKKPIKLKDKDYNIADIYRLAKEENSVKRYKKEQIKTGFAS